MALWVLEDVVFVVQLLSVCLHAEDPGKQLRAICEVNYICTVMEKIAQLKIP